MHIYPEWDVDMMQPQTSHRDGMLRGGDMLSWFTEEPGCFVRPAGACAHLGRVVAAVPERVVALHAPRSAQ